MTGGSSSPAEKGERDEDSGSSDGLSPASSEQPAEPAAGASTANDQESTRTYSCSVCGRSFKRTFDLHRHENLHTGLRPHKCTHCGKSFARHDALVRHCRPHGACVRIKDPQGGSKNLASGSGQALPGLHGAQGAGSTLFSADEPPARAPRPPMSLDDVMPLRADSSFKDYRPHLIGPPMFNPSAGIWGGAAIQTPTIQEINLQVSRETRVIRSLEARIDLLEALLNRALNRIGVLEKAVADHRYT